METKLEAEKKKRDELLALSTKHLEQQQQIDLQREAENDLDTELQHQVEESERRALANTMLDDAAKNSPTFNTSCLNLLSNFQSN